MNVVKAARIRALNDELRCHGRGGQILISRGLASLNPMTLVQVLAAVAAFDRFNPDNDPHGEHDCALVEVDKLRVLFKLDYYDLAMSGHSPDAADPDVTNRVMTVMLAGEY